MGEKIMENYHLFNEDRRNRITGIALDLWQMFCELENSPYGFGSNPDTLCESLLKLGAEQVISVTENHKKEEYPPTWRRNPCALHFFQFCSELFLKKRTAATIHESNLVKQLENLEGRAVSWLCNKPEKIQGTDRPIIAIDNQFLMEGGEIPYAKLYRTFTCLVLHEVGHLIFHWEPLRKLWSEAIYTYQLDVTQSGLSNAEAQHEAEAWFFCFSVFGAAISQLSRSGKKAGKAHDPAWQFCG